MFKKVLFIIITVLVMAAGWILQTNLGLERTFLSPGFYGAIIEEAEKEDLQDYFLKAASPRPEGDVPREELMIYRFLVMTAEENWLKEQAAQATEEYILFIKGDQDEMVINFDLEARREVFLENLEKELKAYFSGQVAEWAPGFLDELLSRLDVPDEMILVEIEEPGDLSPELRAERERINRILPYLRFLPWITFAVLALAGIIWHGAGWTFTAQGLGLLLSGASYLLLWPYGWDSTMVPWIESLASDHSLLELVWAREGEAVIALVENTFNRIATYVAIGGAMLLTFGLFLTACSRLLKKSRQA